MKRLSFGLLGVTIVAATAITSAQTPAPKYKDKVDPAAITLTGCVAKGTESNTFMLTNVHRSDVAAATPGTDVGVYWLNEPEKLKAHVGHTVEVMGKLDSDTDKATVKSKDGKVEISSERGSKKVAVPEGTAAASAVATAGAGGKQINYKVKVDSVKMTSPTCG